MPVPAAASFGAKTDSNTAAATRGAPRDPAAVGEVPLPLFDQQCTKDVPAHGVLAWERKDRARELLALASGLSKRLHQLEASCPRARTIDPGRWSGQVYCRRTNPGRALQQVFRLRQQSETRARHWPTNLGRRIQTCRRQQGQGLLSRHSSRLTEFPSRTNVGRRRAPRSPRLARSRRRS